jgi:hypothetical protein
MSYSRRRRGIKFIGEKLNKFSLIEFDSDFISPKEIEQREISYYGDYTFT